MNKFGTRETPMLIDRLRAESASLAARGEAGNQEMGLLPLLRDAADTLEAANRYFLSVEAALV